MTQPQTAPPPRYGRPVKASVWRPRPARLAPGYMLDLPWVWDCPCGKARGGSNDWARALSAARLHVVEHRMNDRMNGA